MNEHNQKILLILILISLFGFSCMQFYEIQLLKKQVSRMDTTYIDMKLSKLEDKVDTIESSASSHEYDISSLRDEINYIKSDLDDMQRDNSLNQVLSTYPSYSYPY